MKNVPENELFSAYLDGEATAEEQAQVEQLLASSPEARRMLDQMRSLSLTLQSLPAEKSPEDLGSRVLKSAEHRMLSEPADARPPSPLSAAAKTRDFLRRLTRPRVLFWTAATILVAVGLSLYGPKTPTGPTGHGDLARNETESRPCRPAHSRRHCVDRSGAQRRPGDVRSCKARASA